VHAGHALSADRRAQIRQAGARPAITYDIDLYDALKVGLVSVDSTMRSNLSVGLPIDIIIARRDACDAELNYRIEPGEPYFHDLRERWSAALRAAHAGIPRRLPNVR
jgi:putative proteasome-type protease